TKQLKAVRFNALRDELRGFWLIDKTVYLHAHIGTSWYVVQLRSLDKQLIAGLNQVTKQAAHRHLPLTAARLNEQSVTLYLAPLTLVILQGGLVLHSIDRQSISEASWIDGGLVLVSAGQQWLFM